MGVEAGVLLCGRERLYYALLTASATGGQLTILTTTGVALVWIRTKSAEAFHYIQCNLSCVLSAPSLDGARSLPEYHRLETDHLLSVSLSGETVVARMNLFGMTPLT